MVALPHTGQVLSGAVAFTTSTSPSSVVSTCCNCKPLISGRRRARPLLKRSILKEEDEMFMSSILHPFFLLGFLSAKAGKRLEVKKSYTLLANRLSLVLPY
jgi:hypothetical protein